MDRTYLLTYDKEIENSVVKTYEWFEDEEEMNSFIEENNIKPTEKFHIRYVEEID